MPKFFLATLYFFFNWYCCAFKLKSGRLSVLWLRATRFLKNNEITAYQEEIQRFILNYCEIYFSQSSQTICEALQIPKKMQESKASIPAGYELFLLALVEYETLFGSFESTYENRLIYLEFLWSSPVGVSHENKIKAGIELGHYEVLRYEVSKVSLLQKCFHKQFYNVISGLIGGTSKLSDCAGFDALDGKIVGILGPARIHEKTELNCDVLVTTNYALQRFVEKNKFHVTYYNSRRIRDFRCSVEEAIAHLNVVCFKTKNDLEALKKFRRPNTCFRLLSSASSLLLSRTGPNAIQNIIVDLLLNANPAVITLAGITAYLSQEAYQPGYWDDHNKETVAVSVRWHDPLSNFALLKFLIWAGNIRVLDDCKPYLDMSIKQYSIELDKIYSPNSRLGKRDQKSLKGVKCNA